MRNALEELGVFEKLRLGEAIERLKPGVTKHPGHLGEHIVGKNETVAALQELFEQTPRQRGTPIVRPDQSVRVEDNSQWIGL